MTDSSWWVDAGELDDEQSDIVALEASGSFLVKGPPGSGKTNLLLLRASYLVRAQLPNVMVLIFTRSLRDFVANGSKSYSLAHDKVSTIKKWQRRLHAEHGVVVPDTGGFDEIRLAEARATARILDRKPALQHHLDCILVDEVQDCLPEEIEIFRRSARHVFFVGDQRQEIYGRRAIFEEIEKFARPKELTKHYRNGEAICKVADVVGKNFGELPLINSCNYDETKAKSSVSFEECSSLSEESDRIATRIVQQLRAYPDEPIGVACPRKIDVEAMRDALEQKASIRPFLLPEGVAHCSDDSPQRIFVGTMHAAKGLEFRAMHLADVEYLKKMGDAQKRLAYTSITRAKTSLSIYHVAPMPGYLEQARDSQAPTKAPPALASLFLGKK